MSRWKNVFISNQDTLCRTCKEFSADVRYVAIRQFSRVNLTPVF